MTTLFYYCAQWGVVGMLDCSMRMLSIRAAAQNQENNNDVNGRPTCVKKKGTSSDVSTAHKH